MRERKKKVIAKIVLPHIKKSASDFDVCSNGKVSHIYNN